MSLLCIASTSWLLLLFSGSVVSNSLRLHGLQCARFPCPTLSPRACSNSCPLSWWCHPTILFSVILFSRLQFLPHQDLFLWVTSSHQVTKVLEFQFQHQSFKWIFRTDFPQDGLFNLFAVQGLSRIFSNTRVQDHQSFGTHPSLWSNSLIPYMTTGKTIALTIGIFVGKIMSLLYNTLSRFVIAFLPKSKYLSVSWLQSPSAVILEPKKMKSFTVPTFPPSISRSLLVIVWNKAR